MRYSIVIFCFFSNVVLATTDTFHVAIDIEYGVEQLRLSEASPITFPTIYIDEQTPIGSKCYTSSNFSELCSGSQPRSNGRTFGSYHLSGSPNKAIQLTLDFDNELQEGLAFLPSFHQDQELSIMNVQLNSLGQISFSVAGLLELKEKVVIANKTIIFDYIITVSYQ